MRLSDNKPLRDLFAYHRRAWSPRAAFHLARLVHGTRWADRLVSAVWLMHERVPLNGAAPSMNHRGVPK